MHAGAHLATLLVMDPQCVAVVVVLIVVVVVVVVGVFFVFDNGVHGDD
jgi:hypothetical protein